MEAQRPHWCQDYESSRHRWATAQNSTPNWNAPLPYSTFKLKVNEYIESMAEEKSIEEILNLLRKEISFLQWKYHVESLGLFGSYVREEQGPDSDLDLLVTFYEPPGLLKFIELEYYLTDLLGIKVDLVMKNALKPRIGERVLKELINI